MSEQYYDPTKNNTAVYNADVTLQHQYCYTILS